MSQPSKVIQQDFQTSTIGGSQGFNPVDTNGVVCTVLLIEEVTGGQGPATIVTVECNNSKFRAVIGRAYIFKRPIEIRRISCNLANAKITFTWGDGEITNAGPTQSTEGPTIPAGVFAADVLAFPGAVINALVQTAWIKVPAGYKGIKLKTHWSDQAGQLNGAFISMYIQQSALSNPALAPGLYSDIGWYENLQNSPGYFTGNGGYRNIEVYPGFPDNVQQVHNGVSGVGGVDGSWSTTVKFNNALGSWFRIQIYPIGAPAQLNTAIYELIP